jgi:hypothetical protein
MKLNTLVTRKTIFITAFFLLLEVFITDGVFGQVPPPPPPPNSGTNNGHNLGGNQGAPGAPIGGGLGILLVLGAIYTGKKVLATEQNKEEDSVE